MQIENIYVYIFIFKSGAYTSTLPQDADTLSWRDVPELMQQQISLGLLSYGI